MFSKRLERLRATAAWRFSLLATVASAIGSAAAFLIAYLLVNHIIRTRTDQWLSGEAGTLLDVVNSGDGTGEWRTLVRETAEHAVQEMNGEEWSSGDLPVFFLVTDQGGHPVMWVGPDDAQPFLATLQADEPPAEAPRSVKVPGWNHPFRVVAHQTRLGGGTYLGLSDEGALHLFEAAAFSIEGLDRLLCMLNTSLDVAEAKAGALRLHREQIDLSVLAQELVGIYQAPAEERGIEMKADSSGTAMAWLDPDLIRRAVANLLDNAIEHLPPSSHVRVSTRVQAGEVILEVEDDGPGFPDALRDTVFERYVKGPASKGFGLGLPLVRAVAMAHGGTIAIHDRKPRGACIRLSLPRFSHADAA
ncbi:MAG: sensor histidine kinase [Acidobacteriota bacterium]